MGENGKEIQDVNFEIPSSIVLLTEASYMCTADRNQYAENSQKRNTSLLSSP